MTVSAVAEYRRHKLSGSVLMAFAAVCFVIAVIMVIIPNVTWTIIFAVIAMVFSNYAFNHFEQSALFQPDDSPFHELELFSASLKSGAQVNVHMQLMYKGIHSSNALPRIHARLQRKFNIYLSQREALSDEPIAEIDALLQECRSELQDELDLEKLSFETIDVKVSDHSNPKRGLYYGER
jgi:hypothetical protein